MLMYTTKAIFSGNSLILKFSFKWQFGGFSLKHPTKAIPSNHLGKKFCPDIGYCSLRSCKSK